MDIATIKQSDPPSKLQRLRANPCLKRQTDNNPGVRTQIHKSRGRRRRRLLENGKTSKSGNNGTLTGLDLEAGSCRQELARYTNRLQLVGGVGPRKSPNLQRRLGPLGAWKFFFPHVTESKRQTVICDLVWSCLVFYRFRFECCGPLSSGLKLVSAPFTELRQGSGGI